MRRGAWAVLVVMVAAIAADLARAPGDQMAARVAVAGIHAYQATASRVFSASGVTCK